MRTAKKKDEKGHSVEVSVEVSVKEKSSRSGDLLASPKRRRRSEKEEEECLMACTIIANEEAQKMGRRRWRGGGQYASVC